MKKSLTFLLIICVTLLVAQESASGFTENDGERKRNPRMDQLSYVPNEIIVKFKDETTISTASRIKAAGISSVDAVLKKYEIASLERIFPEAKKPARARSVRSPQGKELKVPSLDKIYRMTIPEAEAGATLARPVSIHAVIEELKKLPEVEYAEPNYIYSIDELQSMGPVLSASELTGMKAGKQSTSTSAVVPNDPLYEQQSYLREIKADVAWAQTTGDTTQVIAILDTGVDWTHPDLKNKIWRNWDEIPDNGIDDDGNGYVDDVRGWDFIFNDNNPMDDNSHGTHVAGIVAAETNNGIGIAGVNWGAQVIPIKVFNSKGQGDLLTICRGIEFASKFEPTVINMSFSSYAQSNTLEDVLLDAYLKGSFLVASAGNDNYSIYDGDYYGHDYAGFPAALPFVFGVQSDGGYSNYDPDGPVFSEFGNSWNYELKAPGKVLSTVLNGNYKVLDGTSMSAPIVSGIIALYKSIYPNKTLEELWSNLIHSSTDIVDTKEALFPTSNKVILDLKNFEIDDSDTIYNNDDGFADANETINLFFEVRNTGNAADEVYIKVKLGDDGNLNNVTILNDSAYLGNIGIFRTQRNNQTPIKLKINSDCHDNTFVSLDVMIKHKNSDISIVQNVKFKLFNGANLSGILTKDTTLTPDKRWIINKSLRISQNTTLTILPGTTLEIHSPLDDRSSLIDNRGTIVAIGTSENKIKIKGINGNKYDLFNGNTVLSNVEIDLNGFSLTCSEIENSTIKNSWLIRTNKIASSRITNSMLGLESDTIIKCLYEKSVFGFRGGAPYIINSTFDDIAIGDGSYSQGSSLISCTINNLKNYNYYYNPTSYYYYKNTGFFLRIDELTTQIINNSFLFNDVGTKHITTSGSSDFIILNNQYWGTSNNDKIIKKIYDFNSNSTLPFLLINEKLIQPSDSCPGHVWKVFVNGKDAQDEFVDPVGTGKHRFDVYFNRPMKKDLIPQVSFGGMYPYTSIPINEDGVWSDDGKIYTVYKTIKLTTGDGINRIRVAGAKQDADWGWEIPVEDQRFNFIIAAATSASTDFMATPGLGKVALEWNHNDLEDGLGYNMYRMEHINDSTLTQPVIVNHSLITDTLYTDYSVLPNKKYYYYYKILRTNMAETDSSRVVSAIPFTANKGDANGDLSVNVLDITTIVAHLLNNNPQPFIREAADVNSDSQINVLDIVGVVNLVLNVPQNAPGIAMNKQVDLYLQNDTLFANSNVDIAAVQLDINGVEKFSDLEVLKALKPFESGNSYSNGSMRVIFYSMSGQSIEPGQSIPLLKLKSGSVINDVIIGEPRGASVNVNYIQTRIPDLRANMNQNMVELGQNYPNPASERANTIIPVKIYEPVEKIILRITNLMGQETYVSELYNLKEGRYEFNWNTTNETGVYFYCVEFVSNGKRLVCPAMKMIVN